MRNVKLTRREALRLGGIAALGTLVAACAPQAAPTGAPKEEPTAAPAEQPTEVPAEAPKASGKIQFMMFSWSPENEKFERDRCDAFNQSQSDVVVEPLILPYGDMWTKLDVLVASGQCPDSVWYDYAAYPLIAKGQFMDLTPFVDTVAAMKDDAVYNQGFWKPAMMFGDEKPYCLPIGGEGMNIFYNRDLLDAAEVAYPDDDLTWEGYIDMAQKLAKVEGDKTVQFGASLATMQAWWAWPMIVWSNGGTIVDSHYSPTKATLDTPEVIEALQMLQDLVYKMKAAPDPAQATSLAEQGGDFASGKVATLLDGAWDVVGFRGIDRFKWDIALLPKGSQGRVSPFWIGGPMIAKQSKAPDAAWAWSKWTAEKDGQTIMAKSGQQVPWLRETWDILPEGAVPEHYTKRFETLNNAWPADVWSDKWNQVMDKVWNPEFDKFWKGEITAEQLVKVIDPETTKLLSE